MPGCPNDYKYFDGKVRIKATFVLLVISPPAPAAERESTVCQVYIPMSKKKHKSLKM